MVSKYWTAAATKFCEEQRAAHHIERQGFQFYLPQVAVRRKTTERREYLFPGYIFVMVKDGWERLVNTRGIRKLFFCDGVPTRMSDRDIETLRAKEDRRGLIVLQKPAAVGDTVVVVHGAFKDSLGVVEQLTARDRCRVLLSMMNRSLAVEIDQTSVRVA